jgi:hypothetical protein
MNKKRIKPLLMVVLAFALGWTGSTLSNGQINVGLVTALNSLLGNLLGEDAAGASVVSVTDVDERPGLQVDARAYPTIPNAPVVFNLYRGDTCQTYAQMRVGPGGTRMIVNPEVIPGSASLELEIDYGLTEAFPPGPCYPPDPIIPGGDG